MKNDIKLCVFDLDGTLADTAAGIQYCCNLSIAHHNKTVSREDVIRNIGQGVRHLLEGIYSDLSLPTDAFDEEMKNYQALYTAHAHNYAPLFPGTLTALSHLKQKGIHIATATMKPSAPTHALMAATALSEYLEFVMTADEMRAPKPDPSSIIDCMEHFGVACENTIMVGDSWTDIMAAKAAGVTSVAVLGGYCDEAKLLGCEPDYVLKDIAELAALI